MRILTVSMVLISSDFASTSFGVELGEANFGVLLPGATIRSNEDTEADSAGGAEGAGTSTRIWRERHLMAVVTVLM